MLLKTCLAAGCTGLLTLCTLSAAEVSVVPQQDIFSPPYVYNGLIYLPGAVGSGSLVGRGVVATAAHVVFDETWVPAGNIKFYLRHMDSRFPPSGQNQVPIGVVRWDSYATRSLSDGNDGLSSTDTFNLDMVMLYFADPGSLLRDFAEVDVEDEESINRISLARHDGRLKLLVGYPQDDGSIPLANQGKMHASAIDDYYMEWYGIEELRYSWRDSEDFWVATHMSDELPGISGNSGGPLYALNDQNRWAASAILVGGDDLLGAFFRGFDPEALQLIETASDLRGDHSLRRATGLIAEVHEGQSLRLSWQDRSTFANRYDILRSEAGFWELVASIAAGSTSYIDADVLHGKTYHYRVQPRDFAGNAPMASERASVSIPGADAAIAATLGEPLLHFRSSGDSNWTADDNGNIRSGHVVGMGRSALELSLIGPGTLHFSWSVSSEENPEYGNPNSSMGRDIYDAAFFELNGQRYRIHDDPLFISGVFGPFSHSIQLGAGPQTVAWAYEKDPYLSVGQDAAFLHSVSWEPSATGGYPVFGSYFDPLSGTYRSPWLGDHDGSLAPWIHHPSMGWLYALGFASDALFCHPADPRLPAFITAPDLYPFLYAPASASWFYYLPGSGADGKAHLFDFSSGQWLP